VTSSSGQSEAYEPFFDIHPRTGISIEVFFADRTLETFGRCGAGWFWWSRRRAQRWILRSVNAFMHISPC
jgi:hypothetical protein